jgi:hexosaminidase
MIGKHDNAFANLRAAAKAGRKHSAAGFLITDWGDGGHPQPLVVSYLPYVYGAAVSWCAATADEKLLTHVVNRDVFGDRTGSMGNAVLALGLAHRKFKFRASNLTPFGAVIAAPPPEQRELFCRDGLKYYARVPAKNIRAALKEVEKSRRVLARARPGSAAGKIMAQELDLAARMAAQSGHYMLWQQALAAGRTRAARQMAIRGITELRRIEREFAGYWPARNKGTTAKCAPFLCWRREDYRRSLTNNQKKLEKK